MARTPITVTSITRSGVTAATPVAADASNFNSVANTNGNVVLLATNTDSAAHNVTVHFADVVDGQNVTPRVTAVAAGATMYFGPFSTGEYGEVLDVDADSALVEFAAYLVSV